MADSLKDQLLKAGFKETRSSGADKKAAKKNSGKAAGKKKHKQHSRAQQSTTKPSPGTSTAKGKQDTSTEAAAIAEKKRVKAAIKELIEASALKEFKGETAYSFVLGKKVRQLFVNEEAHKKLSAGELVITRLNGNTQLIPLDQVEPILALNPDWAIVQNEADSDKSAEDDEYKDFQIPDDLSW